LSVTSVILVAGSPFQFTVGPITDIGAHKVRAIGPGLEKGEVAVPGLLCSLIIAYSHFTRDLPVHIKKFYFFNNHLFLLFFICALGLLNVLLGNSGAVIY
jgi:hypothetical protein